MTKRENSPVARGLGRAAAAQAAGLATPSADESREVVTRLHREIFQQGRMDLLDEIVSSDFVVHGPDGDKSREQHFGEDLPVFLAAFPDLTLHVLDSFADGAKVVTRFVFSGTHKGEFQGIAATGTEIELPGIIIERVEDGKVAEAWVQRNDLWLLQQIGAVPTSRESEFPPDE